MKFTQGISTEEYNDFPMISHELLSHNSWQWVWFALPTYPPLPLAVAVSPSGRSQGNGYSGNSSVRKGNNLTAKKAKKPSDSNTSDALTATAGETDPKY